MAHLKNEKDKTLYLAFVEDRSYGYFHLDGQVCTQKFEDHGFRPDSVDDRYSDGLMYSGLRIRCQGDSDSQRKPEHGVYGFEAIYRELWSVDLRLAKRLLKTLALIDTRMGALQEARGYVRTYGEYIGRIAEVLRCKEIGIERRLGAQEITGQKWEWHPIGEGINRINGRIWDWQQEPIRAQARQARQADSDSQDSDSDSQAPADSDSQADSQAPAQAPTPADSQDSQDSEGAHE